MSTQSNNKDALPYMMDLTNSLDDYEQTVRAMLEGGPWNDSDLPERVHQAQEAKRVVEALDDLLLDLHKWGQHMGGWDNPVWDRLREYVLLGVVK